MKKLILFYGVLFFTIIPFYAKGEIKYPVFK